MTFDQPTKHITSIAGDLNYQIPRDTALYVSKANTSIVPPGHDMNKISKRWHAALAHFTEIAQPIAIHAPTKVLVRIDRILNDAPSWAIF